MITWPNCRTYNIELAMMVGVGKAVLLEHIACGVSDGDHDPNQTMIYEGRRYVRGDAQLFAEHLPELTIVSLQRWQKALAGAGYLLREQVTQRRGRRFWYAIGPRAGEQKP